MFPQQEPLGRSDLCRFVPVKQVNGRDRLKSSRCRVLERMTLSEERLKECWTTLREVIADLRSFVETDDYSFIEMAKERVSALEDGEVVRELSGMRDLINNVREMYRKVLEANGKLDDIDHGLLVQQAIYSITRANILAVGIEFRLKRMRGG
jgi:hypothetical protein